MQVVWTDPAVADLTPVHSYIAKDNPTAAARLAATILEAVELLAEQPHLGRAGRVPGTRELIVSGTPYIIPYRVTSDRIEILAVFHGARKWPDAK